MALVVKDRVQETTTTVGTGTVTLGGAVLSFQTFAAIGDGNTTYYAIVDPTAGDWEAGIGTYTASGTTLSRDTVLSSSNGGSPVSFGAGTKNVICTYPSERAIYLDSAGSYPVQNTFNTLNATTATLTAGTVSTTPTAGTDLANKTYVDTVAAAGIHYHTPVYVESPDTAGNLNATYNQPGGAGVGVGATLTNAGTQVALTIDGVLMTVSKRVLIYNQTNAYENGVYTVTTVGDGSTNWVLTRATDADTYAPSSPNSLGQGDAFFVTNGDTGAGEGYVCTTVGTITFGTTAITFSQFSSAQVYSAGTGLNLSPAATFNISNVGTAGTYGGANSVPVFTTNAQGQVTSVTPTSIAIASGAVSGLAASATTDTTDASNITTGTLGTSRLSGSYTGITGVGTLTAGTWNGSTIGAAYGGTGFASYAVGDLLYADTTTSLAQLADVAVGNALISGGVAAAPSWGKIGLATHVDGTLPVANGGTGNTTGNAPTATTATTAIAVTATAASGIQSAYQAALNVTTPGLGTYGIHFNGQLTADFASGITWNGGTTSTNSQAGIYVQGSGGYGTKMYIATTDSYATGAKSAISIDHLGNVNILRGTFTSPQIAANTTTTYGGATQSVTKGGYYGYVMGNTNSHLQVMADTAGNGGFYREASAWPLYYLVANASVGIMGSTTSASAALYVNGAMIATGNITAYSDRRMKKDIVTIDNALEKTNKLRGVYYKKIKEDVKDEAHHDKRQMGVIAQEVLDVAPEVVIYDKENDRYGVSYANMAGLFIEAIKELTDKVATLEAKLEQLTKDKS